MKPSKVRCDHCSKWEEDCQVAIPDMKEEYQDGTVGICRKCQNNTKYTEKYWTDWYEKKYLS